MDLLSQIMALPGVGPYVPWITGTVAVCSVVATRLPPPDVGASAEYKAFYKVVNFIAFNMGHATNAAAPKQETK